MSMRCCNILKLPVSYRVAALTAVVFVAALFFVVVAVVFIYFIVV